MNEHLSAKERAYRLVAISHPDKPNFSDWVNTIEEAEKAAKAEERELRDAAEWLMHVVSGIGKGGGEPEPGELEEAGTVLRSVLSKGGQR